MTVTVPDEAVGLRTKRLTQHRMMSGNVWDGWKLVRRSYYGRCSRICSLKRSRAGVEMERKTVTYTRYWLPERVLRTVQI